MNRHTRYSSRLKKSSQLYLAICGGQDHLVEKLIKDGVDINEPAMIDSAFIGGKPYGVTPIWTAVVEKKLHYLPLLLGSGRTEVPKAVTKWHDAEGNPAPDKNIIERLNVVDPGVQFQKALKQVVESIVPECPDVPPSLWRLADGLAVEADELTLLLHGRSFLHDVYTCLQLGGSPPETEGKSRGQMWAELLGRKCLDAKAEPDVWGRFVFSEFVGREPTLPDLIHRAVMEGLSPDAEIGPYRLVHMAARYDNTAALEVLINAGADIHCPLSRAIKKDGSNLSTPLEIAEAYGSGAAAQMLRAAFARERIDAVLKKRQPAAP